MQQRCLFHFWEYLPLQEGGCGLREANMENQHHQSLVVASMGAKAKSMTYGELASDLGIKGQVPVSK